MKTPVEYCGKTGKIRYENRSIARAALRGLRREGRGKYLNEFQCRGPGNCGGHHLGRHLRRATKAWSG